MTTKINTLMENDIYNPYFKRFISKIFRSINPYYENKVMFEGFIWNLNSFDQEGVELGKTITSDITSQPKKYSDLIDSFTKN